MNDIKNNKFDLFCRVVSLLLMHEHRIKQYDTLNADAYNWWKVKVGNNVCGTTFLCVLLVWWLGVYSLTLSKAPRYFLKVWINVSWKACGMKVFAFMKFELIHFNRIWSNFLVALKLGIKITAHSHKLPMLCQLCFVKRKVKVRGDETAIFG